MNSLDERVGATVNSVALPRVGLSNEGGRVLPGATPPEQLDALAHGHEQVRHHRVVPQVGEPHLRAGHLHRTQQEQPRPDCHVARAMQLQEFV